jgi:predicted metal-dependent peptidase
MGMGLATPKVIKPVMEEMDQELHQRIKLLLLELRTHSPFFGVLASELWLAGPSKSVPTIGVDGRGCIVYNPDFMGKLDPGEIIGCLLHEALHVGLDFWDRFKGLRLRMANIAHDFVINDIIKTSLSTLSFTKKDGKVVHFKIKLPANTLWDAKYKNHSAEEIYAIHMKAVSEKAAALKQQYMEAMSDPVKKAAWDRDRAINKEARESLTKAWEKVSEANKDATNKKKTASDAVIQEGKELDDVLSDLAGINWKDNPVAPQDPEEEPVAPPPPPEPEPTPANAPKNPHEEAKENLKKGLEKAIQDFMQKETQRISDEYDKIPTEATREKHLEELEQDLADIAEDYVDKVTKAPENGVEEPGKDEPGESSPDGDDAPGDQQPSPGNEGDGPQEDGNEPGDGEPGKPGKPGEGKEGPDGQEVPGENGAPGQDGEPSLNNDGQPTDGQPGDQPGQKTDDMGGGEPMPGQEGGQPGEPSMDGEPSSDQSHDGMPGQGGTPGAGQPGQGQPGEGEPGQGEPGAGSQGQGETPYDPNMPYDGQPISEKQARRDVEEALNDLNEELTNSLTGQDGGMNGVDRRMASGKDMIDDQSMDQAYEDAIKELGQNDLEGDININCDHLPGNPFAQETPAETAERKRQTLNRAIQEDLQAGGQGMGSLPNWLKTQIDGILHPPLSFTARMRRFLGKYGREIKRSYSKANKRNTFFENHMIRPGLIKNTATMYVIQDVSGSMMTGKDLNSLRRSMGLIERMAVDQSMEIVVIQCDTGVTSRLNTKQAMEQINKRQFVITGQGGSDLRPAFDMVWKEMMMERAPRGNLICVFTDGAITVPEKAPLGVPQEVLWITCPHQTPPTDKWGKHVVMDDV